MATQTLRRWPDPAVAVRWLVGAVLILAGLAKLVAPEATRQVIEAHGIPDGFVLGWVGGIAEFCAGVLILLGRATRKTAFVCVLVYAPIAIVFHHSMDRALDVAFDVFMIAGLWFLATRKGEDR